MNSYVHLELTVFNYCGMGVSCNNLDRIRNDVVCQSWVGSCGRSMNSAWERVHMAIINNSMEMMVLLLFSWIDGGCGQLHIGCV